MRGPLRACRSGFTSWDYQSTGLTSSGSSCSLGCIARSPAIPTGMLCEFAERVQSKRVTSLSLRGTSWSRSIYNSCVTVANERPTDANWRSSLCQKELGDHEMNVEILNFCEAVGLGIGLIQLVKTGDAVASPASLQHLATASFAREQLSTHVGILTGALNSGLI